MIGKFGSNNFMSLQLILMKLHKITKFVHVYWTTLVIIESFCFNNTKHTQFWAPWNLSPDILDNLGQGNRDAVFLKTLRIQNAFRPN